MTDQPLPPVPEIPQTIGQRPLPFEIPEGAQISTDGAGIVFGSEPYPPVLKEPPARGTAGCAVCEAAVSAACGAVWEPEPGSKFTCDAQSGHAERHHSKVDGGCYRFESA